MKNDQQYKGFAQVSEITIQAREIQPSNEKSAQGGCVQPVEKEKSLASKEIRLREKEGILQVREMH
jgi:hypothetical protein